MEYFLTVGGWRSSFQRALSSNRWGASKLDRQPPNQTTAVRRNIQFEIGQRLRYR
jgi:hypothetical protein